LSTQTQYSLEDAERSGDETRLAEELRNAGPDVAPKVIGILERTRSPRVRNAAALALADMRAAGARDSLIEALRKAETRGHRGTILYALDELGANLPLSLLIDIIVHDPYEAREEALGFLASGRVDRDADPRRVERKLRTALKRGDEERSHAVSEALDYLSEHAPDLRSRFEQFVRTLDGFEDIDALLKERDPRGKRRADYLFSNRSIIVELKTLESDPCDKAQNYLRRLVEENRLVGGYGTFVIDKDTFRGLPDGERLYRNLLYKTSSRLEEIASDADKQTRDTREIFGITEAAGILIVLNQGAQSLIPELLDYRIQDLFKVRNRDGSVRFPHNDMVMVISELHPIRIGSATLLPTRRYVNSTARQREQAIAFTDKLTAAWAAFNGVLDVREADLRGL
jgi:hypothetical protein